MEEQEYCQNETMRKLCKRDPFLYYRIMSYERQQAEDAKQVETFMCAYRQSSINIIRKIQLRQRNQNEENQYKFPLNNRLKNMNRFFQKKDNQQTDLEFKSLKKRKYNLYQQNKLQIKNSLQIKDSIQNNKRGNSSCIKKISSCLKTRNLFVIKKKEKTNTNSESCSRYDSFQLNSPKQINQKNIWKKSSKITQQNHKKLSMRSTSKSDILSSIDDQKILFKVKTKQSRFGRTFYASSQKCKSTQSKDKLYEEFIQNKKNKYGAQQLEYVIIKKGGVMNGNNANKSKFCEQLKKYENY